MISLAGGMSLSGFVPFASTFGAFISSRAKDQARVNDINQTNVKMVATHCGLSVGEDGPTHQAIDDMGSFLGMFNTHVIEPADPNHCDRIIRYIASHYGNFYVRMGRHKIPVLTKEDGSLLYGEDYQYEYGKTEVLRSGSTVTIVASGSVVSEALAAREMSGVEAEIVIAERFSNISSETSSVNFSSGDSVSFDKSQLGEDFTCRLLKIVAEYIEPVESIIFKGKRYYRHLKFEKFKAKCRG